MQELLYEAVDLRDDPWKFSSGILLHVHGVPAVIGKVGRPDPVMIGKYSVLNDLGRLEEPLLDWFRPINGFTDANPERKKLLATNVSRTQVIYLHKFHPEGVQQAESPLLAFAVRSVLLSEQSQKLQSEGIP